MRRAGGHAAAKATAVISATPTAKMPASVALTPKRIDFDGAAQGVRGRETDGAADQDEPRDVPEDDPAHGSGLGPERDTHADLLAARRDRVGEHAVDPDGREDGRERSEGGR